MVNLVQIQEETGIKSEALKGRHKFILDYSYEIKLIMILYQNFHK